MTVSASSSSSAAGASSSGGSGGARAKGQAWVQEARYESVDAALDNGPELSGEGRCGAWVEGQGGGGKG